MLLNSIHDVEVLTKQRFFKGVLVTEKNIEGVIDALAELREVQELYVIEGNGDEGEVIGLTIQNNNTNAATGYIGDVLLKDDNGIYFFLNKYIASELLNFIGN